MKAVADSFFSAPESLWTVTAAVNTKTLAPWKASCEAQTAHHEADVTLLAVCLGKAMAFPVAMCGCERWTIKKAEELMLSNCGAEEDSWESLGLQEEG